jgi:hypothetical protein
MGDNPRISIRGSLFWIRVYNILIDLDLSIRIDWDKYSDEEFLIFPYDILDIMGKYTDLLRKWIRSILYPIHLSLLRDILIFYQGYMKKF